MDDLLARTKVTDLAERKRMFDESEEQRWTVYTAAMLAFSVGQYVAVTAFNVVIGAIAIFASLGTLRLRKILGQAKAAESKGS